MSALGGLFTYFTDGSSANGVATDQDGQLINADMTKNAWHERTVNLSAYAGKTITVIDPFDWTTAPAGAWDIYYGDISLTSQDGSVISLYNRSMMGLNLATNPTVSNASAVTEKVPATDVLTTTEFYVSDPLGSTQMLLSSGGWPLASSQYTPFGTEISTTSNPNHYKFTGLERDQESGLDHAMFRQYASNSGRWLSPDPYNGSMDLGNPQSLNRYAYVNNMPLVYTDPTGQEACAAAFTLGAEGSALGPIPIGIAAGACIAELIGAEKLIDDIVGLFVHPHQIHAATKARPGGIWDEHSGYTPHASVGDILGLPSGGGGCEFGACGSSFSGPGAWSSGAYPNGNDPRDLNLFSGFFDALKETIFGKKPSAACVSEAKAFQAKYVKAAPYSRTVGLFGGIATSSALNSVPGAAYLGYQFAQSQIDAAYTTALRECTAAGR